MGPCERKLSILLAKVDFNKFVERIQEHRVSHASMHTLFKDSLEESPAGDDYYYSTNWQDDFNNYESKISADPLIAAKAQSILVFP